MDETFKQIDILNTEQFNVFINNDKLLLEMYKIFSETPKSGFPLVAGSYEKFKKSYLKYKKTHMHIFLAYNKEELIGVITSYRDERNTAYVDKFVVKEKYQGKGVGKKLMIRAYGNLLKKFKFRKIEMTAKVGAQIINKELCGVSKIGNKKRSFNGSTRYSLSNRSLPKSHLALPVKISLKPKRPKVL